MSDDERSGDKRAEGEATEESTSSPTSHRNLNALVDRFWGARRGSAVKVTTGDLPPTHTLAEEYVVLPSLAKARFLVPTGAPGAVAAAFSAHLSTVSPQSRVYGRLIAGAFRAGVGERIFRDRLRVGTERTVPVERRREHLVLAELAAQLDTSDLVAIHPVRRFTPNAKPTVRLFTRSGAVVGYAKMGWSPPTRQLVQNEGAALAALGGGFPGLTVPEPLSAGRWQGSDGPDLEYLVTTALPSGLRPWRGRPETDAELLLAIAECGTRTAGAVASSTYQRTVDERLEAAQGRQPEEVAALRRWSARLREREDVLEFGRWHGDWISWNLAATPAGGAAWDWEYSAPEVPVGFDVMHWHFQHRLAAAGGTLDTASQALTEGLPSLGALGVPRQSWSLVGELYVLEMLVRAVGLAAGGAGWNPKLHPRLVTFALERATASS